MFKSCLVTRTELVTYKLNSNCVPNKNNFDIVMEENSIRLARNIFKHCISFNPI